MSEKTPDLRLLEDVVAPRVLAHGYPRNTQDVDLLVGDEAFLEQWLRPPTPADVVELIKAGLAVEGVRQYLERHVPPLVARLDECTAQAQAEEG